MTAAHPFFPRPLLYFPAIFLLGALLLPLRPAVALPLRTDGRWIVDGSGDRVKLACVNWASHLQAVVAEGLSKQPVAAISRRITDLGFNCARVTWPLFLATNDSLANLTVLQSLTDLGLRDAVSGFRRNNPGILQLSHIDAFKAVVSSLGENKVMVILDNHISQPGWCCGSNDGNGFFGDQYFDPDTWVAGLTRMATLFSGDPNVVGMSLRNELRGPKQNVDGWHKYMERGAEAVHGANKNVLVILSGLSFDNDLSFLNSRPVSLTFSGKLVLEVHWYAFSDGSAWRDGNPNQVCGSVAGNVRRKAGFLATEKGLPLFVSEFGIDQRGTNVNDNRYLSCFLSAAADLDWDWAVWTLVGDYYLRQGVVGMEEFYGVLAADWSTVRNATFLERLAAVQSPFQGPGMGKGSNAHKAIFHPLTGKCVRRGSLFGALTLGPCSSSELWEYTPQNTLKLKGTYFCLEAEGVGSPAKVGIICGTPETQWEPVSESGLHLASTLADGTRVCLDVAGGNQTVITAACRCLNRDASCDPAGQWFNIINSSRTPAYEEPLLQINRLLDFSWKETLRQSLLGPS